MIRKEEHHKKGDIVYVNPSGCYGNYSQFIKLHWKYAIRWAYKCIPDQTHLFKILGIHTHVMDDQFDRNAYVVAVEDIETKQIFLMGNLFIHGRMVTEKCLQKTKPNTAV